MRIIPLTLFLLSCVVYSVFSLDLRGQLVWNEVCPNLGTLGQAKVVLDNGRLYGGVTRDGSFSIPNVSPGTYILQVIAHDHAFDRLRIDVLEGDDSLPEVRPYIPGTPLSPASKVLLPYPISLSPRVKYDYFIARESFNLIGMFQNPMMMIMLLTGVMMLAMPYLMKNMDPDLLQEVKDRQARIGNIQSSLQSGDLKSGFSAIMANLEDHKNAAAASSGSKPTSSSNVKNRGGKNKKR
ncbi:hypothetical protein C8Q75DRAFT_731154 [Abortiporus biennis]|nr:hypothetical protein C8Q75DRAFT_731154 [Abortiporus biennis]